MMAYKGGERLVEVHGVKSIRGSFYRAAPKRRVSEIDNGN